MVYEIEIPRFRKPLLKFGFGNRGRWVGNWPQPRRQKTNHKNHRQSQPHPNRPKINHRQAQEKNNNRRPQRPFQQPRHINAGHQTGGEYQAESQKNAQIVNRPDGIKKSASGPSERQYKNLHKLE